MRKTKKEIRASFRNGVFKRDKYTCRTCGFKSTPQKAEQELDAHHIIDRSLMPAQGYVLSNGITLCAECHQKAEEWHRSDHLNFVEGYHPDNLFELIESSVKLAVQDSERLNSK